MITPQDLADILTRLELAEEVTLKADRMREIVRLAELGLWTMGIIDKMIVKAGEVYKDE